MFLREILTENQAGVLWQHYPDIIDIVLRGEADTVDLDKLKGIGEKTFETIKTKIVENYCIYDLVIEFGGILTMSMLKKLYDEFKSIPKMKQEQHQMAIDIHHYTPTYSWAYNLIHDEL